MKLFFYSANLFVLQYYLTVISCTATITNRTINVEDGVFSMTNTEEGEEISNKRRLKYIKVIYFSQDSNNSSDQNSDSNANLRIYRANFDLNIHLDCKVPIPKVPCTIYTTPLPLLNGDSANPCINLSHDNVINELFYDIRKSKNLINKLINHADSICVLKVFDRRPFHLSNIVGSDVRSIDYDHFERKYPLSVYTYNLKRKVTSDNAKNMKCTDKNCGSEKNCLYKINIKLSEDDCRHLAIHISRMIESGLSLHRSLFVFDEDDYIKVLNNEKDRAHLSS